MTLRINAVGASEQTRVTADSAASTRRRLGAPAYHPLVGPLGASVAAANLRRSIERLALLKVAAPPGSRLHEALRVLERNNVKALHHPGSKERRLVAEAQRIATEFWMVSSALNPRATISKGLRRELQRSYGGSLDPAQPVVIADRARDAQFHVWLGSWLAMGGAPW